jgi:N-acetylglutamate synthase-like GNAT family acetyltransferase
MSEILFRAPRTDDWPAILSLAELSLAETPIVPSQLEWLNNRKSFSPSDGIQQHFVGTSSDRIVGYACIEHLDKTDDGEYRLWVVVAPGARATLGTTLLASLRERLLSVGARRARMAEYEADVGFISYLETMGFARLNSFKLEDGNPVVELSMDAPFQSLA